MSNTIHALDADTKAMLRSRLAASGITSKTDDEADVGEWLGLTLDALDEAEAATKQALATADGHREYGDRMEAELAASRELVGELMGALETALDDWPTSEVSDADIMRAREVLARARKVPHG